MNEPGRPESPHPSTGLSRRLLLQLAGVAGLAAAAGPHLGPTARSYAAELGQARAEIGTRARPFELGQVRLAASRWTQNQDRTLAYLRSVDVDRLLYNFRANHRLSTQNAQPLGGWEAPSFPFRSHSQGHFLTAWAQAWAVLGDTTCRDKATAMVTELARCQANNGAAGFATGYLSGFPESEFSVVETGTGNGNVPYYAIHKTLAGLLDVWRLLGSTQARDVLLRFAGWVDTRTARLSQAQMQTCLRVEFGGMNAVLADLYLMTDDPRWLAVAQRFDHVSVFDPLAANRDQLNGLHANTQVPKWVGAAREYKSTGTTRYRDIARNAWAITVGAHTYAIGGNSEAEHFRPAGAISTYLDTDTCEQCNTYNMLKLTRELWSLDPDDPRYFDFYERALLNHLLGAQNPSDPLGGFSYFTPLRPGGRRGVSAGPAWGGGTFSTPYTTFWCCQGTGIETSTKYMDSIYFSEGTTLTVNLYMPSTLSWTARDLTVTQATAYPVGDSTTLTIGGRPSGSWTVRVRIPAWAAGASLTLNGAPLGVAAAPGTYAAVTRTWAAGDALTVRLPMSVRVEATNDDPRTGVVLYGPVVLSGNYGDRTLSGPPALDVASVTRTGASSLEFSARADGQDVRLEPFYEAHGHNYTVYWRTTGGQAGGAEASGPYRLVNVGSGLVLGVTGMSTADGGLALQWADNGTADHDWVLVPDGDALKLRNVHSGKVLGVENMSTTDGARVLQWGDTGTADHRWVLVDAGDGTHRVRNVHTSRVLGLQGNATAQGAQAVMSGDDGSVDNRWRVVPTGARRLQNRNSGLMLGVSGMSSADGALVVQWVDTGTADHLWTATLGSDGLLRLRNQHTGKVLAVDGTGNGGRAISTTDTGGATQRWRLRYGADGYFRLQSATGRVLGVDSMSTTQGAQALVWDDSGTADHLWRFV
jgi:DUF1680 family protein